MEKDKNKKKGKIKKILIWTGVTVLTAFGVTLAVSPKLREKTGKVLENVGCKILNKEKPVEEKKPQVDLKKLNQEHPNMYKRRWGGYYSYRKPRYNNKTNNCINA